MDERAKKIPTSRLRRTAKLGGLVGSQGARMYATKAANLTRHEQGRREAAERRQLKAAEHILDVLGGGVFFGRARQCHDFCSCGGAQPRERGGHQ